MKGNFTGVGKMVRRVNWANIKFRGIVSYMGNKHRAVETFQRWANGERVCDLAKEYGVSPARISGLRDQGRRILTWINKIDRRHE